MANVLGELFQDIADAIREKTGSTDTMKPNEFPSAIAGIEAGGGTLVAKTGTFTPSSKAIQTINHGLGVVPLVFHVSVTNGTNSDKVGSGQLYYAFGVSKAVLDAAGIIGLMAYANYSARFWGALSSDYYIDTTNDSRELNSATESTIVFGTSNYKPAAGAEYRWIAIGIK